MSFKLSLLYGFSSSKYEEFHLMDIEMLVGYVGTFLGIGDIRT